MNESQSSDLSLHDEDASVRIYMNQFTKPWKWTSKVVQLAWCRHVGLDGYLSLFSKVDGKRLLKHIDLNWMQSHGIPNHLAVIAMNDIHGLRKYAEGAGFLVKLRLSS